MGLLCNLLPSSICLGPTTQQAAELLAALPDSEFDAVAGFGNRARVLQEADLASAGALAAKDGLNWLAGTCDSMSTPTAGSIRKAQADEANTAAAATSALPLADPAAHQTDHTNLSRQQQPQRPKQQPQQPITTAGDAANDDDHDEEVTDEIEDSDDDFQQRCQRAPGRTTTAARPGVGISNAAGPLPAAGTHTSGCRGRRTPQPAAATEAAADVALIVQTPGAAKSPATARGAKARSAAKTSHGARAASAPACANSAAATAVTVPGAAAAVSAGKAGLSARAALSGLKKRRSSAHHAAAVLAASATAAADQQGPASVLKGQVVLKGPAGHQGSLEGMLTPVAGNSHQAQRSSLQPQQHADIRLSGAGRDSSSSRHRAAGAAATAGDIAGVHHQHGCTDTITPNLQVQQQQDVHGLLPPVGQPGQSRRHAYHGRSSWCCCSCAGEKAAEQTAAAARAADVQGTCSCHQSAPQQPCSF